LASAKELKKQKGDELDRCCDLRFNRLRQFIDSFGPLTHIVFEDVQFLSTQLQAQLWAGLRTTVVLHFPAVVVKCLPVGTLKKFATGHGNATKEMMLEALTRNHADRFVNSALKLGGVQEKFSGRPVDDNEADAFHLLVWALKEAPTWKQ